MSKLTAEELAEIRDRHENRCKCVHCGHAERLHSPLDDWYCTVPGCDCEAFISFTLPSADVSALLAHIGAQEAQNAKLREALKQAERVATGMHHWGDVVGGTDPEEGSYAIVGCRLCKRDFKIWHRTGEKTGDHADACPFKVLEE